MIRPVAIRHDFSRGSTSAGKSPEREARTATNSVELAYRRTPERMAAPARLILARALLRPGRRAAKACNTPTGTQLITVPDDRELHHASAAEVERRSQPLRNRN